ncbi:MAG TPA: ADP-ribosylation factor-like protein [Thermoanaerobaculia bacterium]
MVVYNAATRELTAKIVYYGPGLGGKTTNLHVLHDRLEPSTVGKLLNLATPNDRTIYFDLLPVELGDIKGYKIRFQLATVPGQAAFNETRRVVLKGVDGIVFVADSQWTMLPKNLESWQNLKDNLRENGVPFESIPIVIQYNKRDLPDILSIEALQEALGLSSYPFVEGVASAGRGVTETFKLISKLTFVDLLRRLQGRKPEEAMRPTAPPPMTAASAREELEAFKNSLLARGTGQAPAAPAEPVAEEQEAIAPALSAVPPLPAAEEAPFETTEFPAVEEELAEGPFAGAPPAAPIAEAEDVSTIDELTLPAAEEVEEEPAAFTEAPGAFAEELGDAEEPGISFPSHPEPWVEIPEISVGPDVESSSPALVSGPQAPPVDDSRVVALENRLAALEEELAHAAEARERAEAEAREFRGRVEAFERDSRAMGKGLHEKVEALDRGLGERVTEVRNRVTEVGDRIAGVEKTVGAPADLEARVAAMADRATEDRRVAETRLAALEDRVAAEARRQRSAEDDVAMALKSLGDKAEKLHQQVSELAGQWKALEVSVQDRLTQSRREAEENGTQLRAVEERLGQGRREAEDIRQQIQPLLDAESRRAEADTRLISEMDRLRENVADALGDVAEKLRRIVGR